MNLWELFVNKITVLIITFATIIGFYSPTPAVVISEPPASDTKVEEIVENTATSTEEVENDTELGFIPDRSFPTPDDLLDLEKKIEELRLQINRELATRSPEPNLFTVADINTKTRGALVNILCISGSPKVKSITGSGVVIDPRGVILTNAHVGQLFLLRDYPYTGAVKCSIRGGSPASPLYVANLLYLPSVWINANKTVLTDLNPQGTGEHDYSFLLVTEALSGVKPKEFPYLEMVIADSEIEVGKTTVVAGYAAGFLGGITVQKELYPVSAVSKILELFTFKDQSLDLFSVGGSVVAQKGSSGGAVVNENAELVGIIVTSTDAVNTADRDLRAITISHINRSLSDNRGSSLSSLLLGDLDSKSDNFNDTEAPNLTQILIKNIEGAQ